MYVCMYVCVYVRTYVCMLVCLCMYMYMHVYVYMYKCIVGRFEFKIGSKNFGWTKRFKIFSPSLFLPYFLV